MLKGLFGSGRPAKIPLTKMPQLHSFVDVSVSGRPPKSVSVESVGPKNIVTGDVGSASGVATFVYSNASGKFRFSVRIVGARGKLTLYEMPRKIETMQAMAGAQKRTAVRMDTIVPGFWRNAKNGRGIGDYAKGNIRDISRGGCSLIIDEEKKKGAYVEVKMMLKSGAPPLELIGEVMRTDHIPSSGKFSHGLRFHGVLPDHDRAIMEFINRRQTDLRSRGLA